MDALLARTEDKPVLLSIGYSACHWCHVMAHESFENEETAAVMNEFYVNIKVDREERPDLDKIYQTAHQLLAQRPGGWPLTLFLSPEDHTPFFAGTYFPDKPRHGLPAFKDLLQRIIKAYRGENTQIQEQNHALRQAFGQLNPRIEGSAPALNEAPLATAHQQLTQSFDESHGGFGQAPKFPPPSNLNRLLRHWATENSAGTADHHTRYIVEHTLTRMAQGGINDQLGGGFCRYSVDDYWMIPHFEKMLYDNGPLLRLYSDLWQLSGITLYRETAEKTAHWVMREMQAPEGGYYSSLDALEEQLNPTEVIVIRGEAAELDRWKKRAGRHYAPRRLVLGISTSETRLPGLLNQREPALSTRAYICRGTRCELSSEDFDDFAQRLSATEPGRHASGPEST
ncbi:MAG: DUF255 domain-containing protein [Gammaproteobacteria bacterium]|nr:DUF255 domain-containing protein [Gammaproteobacteria bacterium]